MPTAICDNCSKVIDWRNTRGSRQPETCSCGGHISKARYNYDTKQYERLDVQSKTAGRKFEKCALCGKRRTVPGGGHRVKTDTEFWGDEAGRWEKRLVTAGAMVCWWHTPVVKPEPSAPRPNSAA